jgi:hypothetical protein
VTIHTVVAPCMSLSHLHSDRASAALLLLEILLGIMEVIRGAMSLIRCLDSHLSFQNKVLVPSPTSEITAIEKNACSPAFTCIGSEAQGLLGSIFLSHNNLSMSAQFRILRSEITRPPALLDVSPLAKQSNSVLPMLLFAPATSNFDESC